MKDAPVQTKVMGRLCHTQLIVSTCPDATVPAPCLLQYIEVLPLTKRSTSTQKYHTSVLRLCPTALVLTDRRTAANADALVALTTDGEMSVLES